MQQNQKVHAKDFFEGLRSAAHEKRPAQERMLVPFIDFETHPGTGRCGSPLIRASLVSGAGEEPCLISCAVHNHRSSPVRELHSAPKSKAKASLQPTKQKFGQANERYACGPSAQRTPGASRHLSNMTCCVCRPKQAPGKVPASQEKQRRPSPDSNGRTMPRRPTSPLPPTLPPLTPTQKSNQGARCGLPVPASVLGATLAPLPWQLRVLPLTCGVRLAAGRVTPVRAQPCKPGPAALAVKALQQQVLSNWAGPAFSLPPAPERLPMPSKALLGDRAGKGAASPTP